MVDHDLGVGRSQGTSNYVSRKEIRESKLQSREVAGPASGLSDALRQVAEAFHLLAMVLADPPDLALAQFVLPAPGLAAAEEPLLVV